MKDQDRDLMMLLRNKGVHYIIIYPGWYESLMGMYGGIMEKVFSARLVNNTICGGIELFVYEINWEKFDITNGTKLN